MSMTAEKTVRELALENTTATRVFEKLGIDYCCGGNKSLEEACRASNVSVDQVLDSLEMAEQAAHAAQKDRNWKLSPSRIWSCTLRTRTISTRVRKWLALFLSWIKFAPSTGRTIPSCRTSEPAFWDWSRS